MKQNRPSRRHFLRASIGALALPLLDSLRADAADAAAPPKRLVLLYTPNGTAPEAWFPTAGASSTDFTLNAIHQPLSPYKDRLVLLKGVNSAVGQDPNNNGGPHQRGIGSLFTGQLLGEGQFKDGCGSLAGWAAGPSIDQEVASLIGQDTLLASLELGVRCMDNDVQGRICYAGAGLPLPPINEPINTYERLFFRTTPAPNAEMRAQSILTAVGDQFSTLRPRLGQEDRQKLDAHLALVEDLERRMGLGEEGDGCTPPLPPPADLDADDETTMPTVSRLQLDLLAVAFACDLTRVASVQYSTGFNRIRFPWVDSLEEGHALSHSGDSDTAAWARLATRQTWHAGELAYLMQRLSEIPEGDGSVLDNTLIVWGTEVAKGNSHSLNDIPYLLAGSAGGALHTGQYLQLENVSNSRLLLTILRAYGYAEESFGHPEYAGAEISGLLA